jgi:hypothetical protein
MIRSDTYLVFRRNFAGRLEATVEFGEVRSTKHDKPVGDRYVLTLEQAQLPIDELVALAAARKLEKWVAPPPAPKDVKELNAKLAGKAAP